MKFKFKIDLKKISYFLFEQIILQILIFVCSSIIKPTLFPSDYIEPSVFDRIAAFHEYSNTVEDLQLTINSNTTSFTDILPILHNNDIYLPLEFVMDFSGYSVAYDKNNFIIDSGLHILSKPVYNPNSLAYVLDDVYYVSIHRYISLMKNIYGVSLNGGYLAEINTLMFVID